MSAFDPGCPKCGGDTVGDPSDRRPICGCPRPERITDTQIIAYRDDHREAGDLEVARCCSAALGIPTGDGALGMLDRVMCRARIEACINASLKLVDWYTLESIAARKPGMRYGMYVTPDDVDRARESRPDLISAEVACDAKELPRGPNEQALRPVDADWAKVRVASVLRLVDLKDRP